MKFNELNTAKQKRSTRVGRGIAAGKGKTAGRGTKGQNARKSGGTRPGFEGGQNPLAQRLPKLPGFRSIRPKAENIYTGQVNHLGSVVDTTKLAEAGLISNPYVRVKVILGGPELTKKVVVKLQASSASAVNAIEKAGGSFESVTRLQRPATKKEKTTE